MNRIKYFDIAKGIAILAVIIGHCALEVNDFIPQISAQIVYEICFFFPYAAFLYLVRLFYAPGTFFSLG